MKRQGSTIMLLDVSEIENSLYKIFNFSDVFGHFYRTCMEVHHHCSLYILVHQPELNDLVLSSTPL